MLVCLTRYRYFCIAVSMLASISMMAFGTEACVHGNNVGIPLLLFGSIMNIMEWLYFINKCAELLCRTNQASVLSAIWRVLADPHGWIKGIFYILFSIPCFVDLQRNWLTGLSGGTVIISGILYFIHSFAVYRYSKRFQSSRTGNRYSIDPDLYNFPSDDAFIDPYLDNPSSEPKLVIVRDDDAL